MDCPEFINNVLRVRLTLLVCHDCENAGNFGIALCFVINFDSLMRMIKQLLVSGNIYFKISPAAVKGKSLIIASFEVKYFKISPAAPK